MKTMKAMRRIGRRSAFVLAFLAMIAPIQLDAHNISSKIP